MWLPEDLPDGVGAVASVLSCSLLTESPPMSFSQIAEAQTSRRRHREGTGRRKKRRGRKPGSPRPCSDITEETKAEVDSPRTESQNQGRKKP